ncbi:olfactory receptor 8U3-like [Mycteria americana]|uniref:olfactory receptor 8U3-like n=1 Tax=Mycteria americana TaxID=33587 RepID=UPI003F58639D
MVEDNYTFASEFILLGFTNREDLQVTCFVLFLATYVVTLIGNLGVIVLIRIDSCLHTPMYFFLSHLSLLDVCYSSAIIPQTLMNVFVEKKVISFVRCATQLFSFATCATTECYVLAAMAYDRYMAICNPLLYSVVMSQRLCVGMLAGAYLAGVISSTIHTVSIFRLPFCRSKRINHFFCDGPPLLALSCSDTRVNEAMVSAVVGFNVLSTTVFILVSYLLVLSTVLRMRSAAGWHKAFSTCASHLVSIALYYGSSLFTYLHPGLSHSLEHDEVVSVLYSVAVPMLNPLIYSLRNTDMKKAMRKATGRVFSSLSIHSSWSAERRGLPFHAKVLAVWGRLMMEVEQAQYRAVWIRDFKLRYSPCRHTSYPGSLGDPAPKHLPSYHGSDPSDGLLRELQAPRRPAPFLLSKQGWKVTYELVTTGRLYGMETCTSRTQPM